MLDFTMQNLDRIKAHIKADFQLMFNGEIYYNVKRKYSSCIWIELKNPPDENEIMRNFVLHFKPFQEKRLCTKSQACCYTGRSDNLTRHEKTCNDEQLTISQQVDYGLDKTVIKRLFDLGYLPEEALRYRKDFITTFDIECLEDREHAESLKNVEAVHRIVSVAISTNRGHSNCFIRNDSSHEAVVKMFEKFLDYLDEINAMHDDELPDYFHEAIEHIELMCSSESTLLKSDKMELEKLKRTLEKYMLHDVFGFNSGKNSYKNLYQSYYSFKQNMIFQLWLLIYFQL